jgi:hypothetical protein
MEYILQRTSPHQTTLTGINTPYRWHRAWLLIMHKMHRTDNITRRVRSAHRVTLMMHGMHHTKNITAPNNINGASIHRTGGIERGY